MTSIRADTRRNLLRYSGVFAGTTGLLAACAPAVPTAPVSTPTAIAPGAQEVPAGIGEVQILTAVRASHDG